MALTRPKFYQVDTTITAFNDPITVLRSGATQANVDVGFLFNRANGLVSNVALVWSEATQSFITAYTDGTGATNSNISVSSYANIRTGNITANGFFWSNGTVFSSGSTFTGGYVQNTIIAAANLVANSGTASSSTTTGALVVAGGSGIAGALYVGGTGNFAGNLTTGHILPSANITYDIGSPTLRFRTLYISGNTIDMGGASITTDSTSGGFAFVPKPTSDNPNPIGTVFGPTGSITTVNTTGGVLDSGAINTSINTNQGIANFGRVVIKSDIAGTSTTTGALVVTGGVGIAGALYIANTGDVSANIGSLLAYAGGQAAGINSINANLGTATTNITTLFSNAAGQANQITGANAAIVTANTSLKSYVDTQDSTITTAWTANAATQATSINTINANLGIATNNITTLFSNAAGQANQIAGANAAIVTANSAVVSFVGMVNNNLSTAITANTNAANTAATTANTSMKSYVDAQDSSITTAWTSNAATQAIAINSINTNLGTATTNITTLFSNAAGQANQIAGANAAIVTANSAVVSFVGTVNSNLSSAITANTNAANTAATTANTNMKSYVDAQDSSITTAWTSNAAAQATSLNSINANLGTATTNITNLQSNAGTQQSQINSIVTNANANVAAYLPTYSGSLGGTLTTAAQTNITSVGTLTGLTSSGIVNITNSTQSSDNTTGALVVTGGAAVGANLHVGGSLHITGNLEVNGTQTIFNTNVSIIEDSMIYMGDDNTGDSVDIGIVSSFTNPAYQHTGFVRDASDGVWKLFANVVAEPTTVVDFTNATYSPLRIGALTATSGTYSGAIIASTLSAGTIGNSGATLTGTLSTASQTNITGVGTITTGTWTATDIGLAHGGTNATLTAVNGGIVYSTASAMDISAAGTAGQILNSNGAAAPTWVNQNTLAVNTANYASAANVAIYESVTATTTNATHYPMLSGVTGGNTASFTSSSLVYNPGTGNLVVAGTTVSTSTTTGALVVAGGVGVAGNLNVGGTLNTFSGNVGIGNTAPVSKLHVQGATSGDGGSFNGTGSALYVKQDTTWSGNQPWALYVSGYSYLNGFRINASDGIRALYKTSAGGQLGFATTGDDPITFTQSNSLERMRIAVGGNVVVTGNTTSTSSTTGALVVKGGVGVAGQMTVASNISLSESGGAGTRTILSSSGSGAIINHNDNSDVFLQTQGNTRIQILNGSGIVSFPYGITANSSGIRSTFANIITTNGVYWANGAAYSSGSGGGITYTASATAPGSPSAGNFWYDTSTDTKYQYIYDGAGSYWEDLSYPTSFGNLTVANTLTVSGSIVGTVTNANYSLAANVAIYESVTATTTNATFYPMLSGITTGNTASFTSSSLVYNPSTGNLVVASTTASTSTTTGALVVRGGVGIAGATQAAAITSSGTIIASTVNAGTIGNSGATLTGTISTSAQTNITSVGSLSSLTINTANTAVDGAHVYSVNAATVSQLTLHATSGTVNRQSKLKFTGTFFNTPGDVGERYTTSIRSGFDSTSNAWGSEFLGIYVNNTTNDSNSDANQRLIASFSNYAGITASANVVPSANLTYNLGSTTAWWNNVYGVSVQAKYADLAEHYTADDLYGPGTVVVFGGAKEITVSNISHDPRVAGVISTNPAYLMNAANAGLPVALTGRVPCQVQGPVAKGDRLVNIDTGVAGRLNPALHEYGCIIGKSLGEIADDSIQTIEIVVGRF